MRVIFPRFLLSLLLLSVGSTNAGMYTKFERSRYSIVGYYDKGKPKFQLWLATGCQNTREWGIRFPESSGLNHNLADRFRENKKFKAFLE